MLSIVHMLLLPLLFVLIWLSLEYNENEEDIVVAVVVVAVVVDDDDDGCGGGGDVRETTTNVVDVVGDNWKSTVISLYYYVWFCFHFFLISDEMQ